MPPFPANGRVPSPSPGAMGLAATLMTTRQRWDSRCCMFPRCETAPRSEDRGNAIVSTEPLHTPFAVELPLERQRRVAVGAGIDVRTPNGLDRLDVLVRTSNHSVPLRRCGFSKARDRARSWLCSTCFERRAHQRVGVRQAACWVATSIRSRQALMKETPSLGPGREVC